MQNGLRLGKCRTHLGIGKIQFKYILTKKGLIFWKLWHSLYFSTLLLTCNKSSTPSTYSSAIASNSESLTCIPSSKSKSIISGFSFMIAMERPDLPKGSLQLMSNREGLLLYVLINFATEAQSPRSTNRRKRFSSGVNT